MGVVYCAEDTREPGREVALKVISEGGQGSKNDDTARRFVREAKILEGLRHPNIVSFFDVGLQGETSYFAMELLSGASLRAYMALPFQELLPLFIQICQGMEYLASRGIVHRDLSPDNIFIVQDGRRKLAKILDFGIAKDMTGQETLHNFTMTGMLMGKPQYWSPEQIEKPRDGIDWRSDVYALGVIFYRTLTGELPFDAETPAAFITKHLFEPPPPMVTPEGRPPIPDSVATLILRMLEKDREHRPQSYREIVDTMMPELAPESRTDISRFLESLPVVEPTYSTLRSPSPRTAQVPRGELDTAVTARYEKSAVTKQGGEADLLPTQAMPLAVPKVAETVVSGLTGEHRRPEGTGSRALLVAGIAAALVVAVGGGVLFLRSRDDVKPTPVATAAIPTPAVLATGPGFLALDAVPWARVVSIVDQTTRQARPVAADVVTPVRLELPPGVYMIQLAAGAGGATKDLLVEIRSGEQVKTVSLSTAEQAVNLLD